MKMLSLFRLPNVRLLFAAQALGMAASPFNTLLGGIIGSKLAPDPRLATLPVALVIVGLAAGTVPVALFMRRHGRRAGFMFAASAATLGALLAAFAIQADNFWLFCAATPLLGFNLAAVQQYRFAVTENVDTADMPRSVSLVLLGTLVAAFIGPFLAESAEPAAGLSQHTTAYLMLAAVLMISVLLLSKYREQRQQAKTLPSGGRRMREIVFQPAFAVAALAAAVAYGIMSFLMTATPVAMHVLDGHSLGHTAGVIQAHIAAMYLPSLVSGRLIQRFGELRLMVAGIFILLACVAVASLGHEVMHYALALVLLGIGWNFLFVSGTTLLSRTWRPEERFRVQAANDFLVFSVSSLSSLASGAAVHALGWNTLLLAALPPLGLLLVALLAMRRRLPAAA